MLKNFHCPSLLWFFFFTRRFITWKFATRIFSDLRYFQEVMLYLLLDQLSVKQCCRQFRRISHDFQHSTPQNNNTFIINYYQWHTCVFLVLDVDGSWSQWQVAWLLASLEEELGDQRLDWIILWLDWHHNPTGSWVLLSKTILVIVQWLQLCK